MKRYIKAYGGIVFWTLLALLVVALCGWSGTVTTSTSIYSYPISKGYTVYATTIGPTAASGEVVPYSAVSSPGYAAPGKRVKVIGYELNANGSVNAKFQSGGTADIGGSTLWYLAQNSGVTKPITLINNQPIVYMQTAAGASLSINLSAAQNVSGSILYFVE